MTTARKALDLALRAARLKWVPRTGWMMRGVVDPETVADHSWGVSFLALILAGEAEEPLDREKLLTTALLHDLAEAVLSDIPSPAVRFFSPEAKRQAEGDVLREMLASLEDGERMQEWWYEFETGSSPEGCLVRDADRLDMLLQALMYERSRGARLDEFWEGSRRFSFHCSFSKELYEALLRVREE